MKKFALVVNFPIIGSFGTYDSYNHILGFRCGYAMGGVFDSKIKSAGRKLYSADGAASFTKLKEILEEVQMDKKNLQRTLHKVWSLTNFSFCFLNQGSNQLSLGLCTRHGHRSKKILAASYMKQYDVKSP